MGKKIKIYIAVLLILVLAAAALLSSTVWETGHYMQYRFPGLFMINETCEDYSFETEGNERIYSFTLPDSESLQSENIYVWAVHAFSKLYLNDVLIYERGPENDRVGKTPGRYFAALPLVNASSGDRVRIELTPVYDSEPENELYIYMATEYSMMKYLVNKDGVELMIGFICAVLGLLYLFFSFTLLFGREESNSIFYLGLFTLMFGIWVISEKQLTNYLIRNNNGVISFISLLSLLLLPYCFIRFLGAVYGNGKMYKVLRVVTAIETVGILLVHMTGLFDIRECLPVIIFIILVIAVIIFVRAVIRLVKQKNTAEEIFYIVFYAIVAVACIADVVRYYVTGSSLHVSYMLWIMLSYLIVRGCLSFRNAIKQRENLAKRELELENQKMTVMMSQMRPHFIFNTMNAISNLCEEDGSAAKKAIHDFSSYLRQNFEGAEMNEVHPFSKELEHARFYLEIEKLRFGQDLSAEYDIQAEDFSLPPLTLQPLVENAVRHGIRRSGGPGTVMIKSCEDEESYVVEISDDGAGFDPAEYEKNPEGHLGIRNVRERLKNMCGGTLEINSVTDEGTIVRLRIPKG